MRRYFVASAVVALMACMPTETQRLSIVMQADPATANVGDTVRFHTNVQSTRLTKIEVSYGDARTDSTAFPEASSAQWTFKHVYAQAGTYQVEATAVDITAGIAKASVSVTIQ